MIDIYGVCRGALGIVSFSYIDSWNEVQGMRSQARNSPRMRQVWRMELLPFSSQTNNLGSHFPFPLPFSLTTKSKMKSTFLVSQLFSRFSRLRRAGGLWAMLICLGSIHHLEGQFE